MKWGAPRLVCGSAQLEARGFGGLVAEGHVVFALAGAAAALLAQAEWLGGLGELSGLG